MRLVLASAFLLLPGSPVMGDEWKDPSPHKSDFVKVNGIRLHYLDWGGTGEPLIFLAGMGSSAHTFDDLAPRFKDRFRVIALTRRGTAESERPESGYTLDHLAEDIKAFMDHLGFKSANLAGHSLGGDEITVFAGKYPDRVKKLVYLDGAFNRSKEFNEPLQKEMAAIKDPLRDRLSQFAPNPAAMASMDTLKKWYTGNGWTWKACVEANVRAAWLTEGKLNPSAAMSPAFARELFPYAQAHPPDFAKVKAAVLSLTAIRKTHPALRPGDSEETRKEAAKAWETAMNIRRRHSEHLSKTVPTAKIVEIDGDHGQLFHEREEEVYREMRAFLTMP
jgi:pimeloyl-ACP methyl ester carboxylesterase